MSVADASNDNDTADICTLLQAIQDHKPLPNDFKIPSKPWNLLSQEAQDGFIQEHAKLLKPPEGTPTSDPSSSVPKQYGGVSQTHHANASTVEPINATDNLEDSNTSSDNEETI